MPDARNSEMKRVKVREEMGRHIRRIRILVFAAAAVFIGSILLMISFTSKHGSSYHIYVMIIICNICASVALFWIAGIYAILTIRCPWCRGNLSSPRYPDLLFGLVRFCPGCGKSLDDELPQKCKGGGLIVEKSKWDELA